MKIKFLVYIGLLGLITHTSFAQQTTNYQNDTFDNLLEAQEAFRMSNYLLAEQITCNQLMPPVRLSDYVQNDAELLRALSYAAEGEKVAESLLLKYVEAHPHSAYTDYVCFALGNYYYNENKESANYWYSKVYPMLFPKDLKEDYYYRYAYALMYTKQYDEAYDYFNALSSSKRYKDDALYNKAYILYRQRSYKKAYETFERISNDSKYYAQAMAFKAEIFLSLKQYQKALNTAKQVLGENGIQKKSDFYTSALRVAGISTFYMGRYNVSLNYMTDYISSKDETEISRLEKFIYARDLFEGSSYSEAIQYFMKVASENDYMTQLSYYYSGLSALSQNKADVAASYFQKAENEDVYPLLSESALYNYAMILYRNNQGEPGQGTTELIRYLNSYPKGIQEQTVIGYLQEAFSATQQYDLALKQINSIRRMPPNFVKLKQRLKLRQANNYLGSGDTQRASRQYDLIIAENKDQQSVLEALLWKSELAYRNNDYESTLRYGNEYLRRLGGTDAANAMVYYNLGYSYYNLKRWGEAESTLLKYLKSIDKPGSISDAEIYNRLGDIAQQLRQYEDAIHYYTNVQNVKGASGNEDAYALLSMGKIYGLKKDYNKEIILLERLAERYPSSTYLPEVLYEKGRSQTFINDTTGAQKSFEQVLFRHAVSTFAPKAGVQLAMLYYNAKNMDKAAELYEYVIQKYPHTDAAQSALQDYKSISVKLNKVDKYQSLLAQVNGGQLSEGQADSLQYLAAEGLLADKRSNDAENALKQYLEKYPNGQFTDNAKLYLADIYFNRKNYREALPLLEALERSSNRTIQVKRLEYLANIYSEQNVPGRAAEVYLQLAKQYTEPAKRTRALNQALDMAKKSNSKGFIKSLAEDVRSGKLSAANAKDNILAEAALLALSENRQSEAEAYIQAFSPGANQTQKQIASLVRAYKAWNTANIASAKRMATAIVKQGSSNTYVLSKTFILLADIAVKEGDRALAKEYLEGVKSNYKYTGDEILSTVNEKLQVLK